MVKMYEQDRRREDVESISKISDSEFNNFRKRHLDVGILSDENLEAIRGLVGADRGEICCDDYHPHKYSCISFDTCEGAIYERLIQEVRRYKVLFNKYQEIIKEATREN